MDFDDLLPDLDLPDDNLFVTHEQVSINIRHERRAAKREFAIGLRHEALIDLVPSLPPPDTDYLIISTGDGAQGRHGRKHGHFDFGDFLPHAVNLLGGAGCTAYVSTWCCNSDHVQTMLELLQTGQVDRFTFFSDPYFQSRTPAIAAQLLTGLQAFPDRARFKLFKNHCKIIAVASADRQRFCTVTGSANLNMQMRAEQYHLSTGRDVYDWITSAFFETMLRRQDRTGIQHRNRKGKPQ